MTVAKYNALWCSLKMCLEMQKQPFLKRLISIFNPCYMIEYHLESIIAYYIQWMVMHLTNFNLSHQKYRAIVSDHIYYLVSALIVSDTFDATRSLLNIVVTMQDCKMHKCAMPMTLHLLKGWKLKINFSPGAGSRLRMIFEFELCAHNHATLKLWHLANNIKPTPILLARAPCSWPTPLT